MLFFQRLLRAEGLYAGALDGEWGPDTEKAAQEFERHTEQFRLELRTFDSRSEQNIVTLSLKAQRAARLFLGRVLDGGLIVRIISGTRTYAEQNVLFRRGRYGNSGQIVTNVRGGFSNNNFGIAWDIGLFTASGGYLSAGPEYDKTAASGLSPEIEWGGHWRSFADKPHYQLRLGVSIGELRTKFERGEAVTAFV